MIDDAGQFYERVLTELGRQFTAWKGQQNMWHLDGGWSWWMLVGMVAMAAFWIAVIWVVIAIVRRWPDQSEERHARQKTASLQILERRYASGELTTDEFEAMKRRLIE